MNKKIPNFIPLQTALIDDIRIKRLNKDHLNCSGLGILVGLLFYLLKSPNQTCSYDEIDIIADELRASIPIIQTVIEKYKLFEITENSNGKKFFSPMLNNSLEPYFNICEINKVRSDLATIKRKEKIKKQKEELELKQLELNLNNSLKIESSGLNSPNIIYSNLIEFNSIENNSSSSHIFSWENEKDFEEFFNYIKENTREVIKSDKYYKNTLLQNIKNGDSKTLENWNDFLAYKKENEKRAFIRRIENLESEQILYQNQYRYISKIEIFEHLEEFKIITSHFEINHLISCKFSQLEEIEKLIKKENSF
ncbi:hypothetical protein [Aliarcobacter cryaerophilus]|uniref:hypothetical protein n=1 Tax=Aliarcobacter cryaerophilus TaxID=28198 RepID=UPI0021B1B705|nr:hypothetical protein [Aliarcobacter cryaerophilus]MCT7483410.1 hypothetical protein [Aliarcobacter cryaerophilus]